MGKLFNHEFNNFYINLLFLTVTLNIFKYVSQYVLFKIKFKEKQIFGFHTFGTMKNI